MYYLVMASLGKQEEEFALFRISSNLILFNAPSQSRAPHRMHKIKKFIHVPITSLINSRLDQARAWTNSGYTVSLMKFIGDTQIVSRSKIAWLD